MAIREIKPQYNSLIAAIIRKVITEFNAPKTGIVFADSELDFLNKVFKGI